MGGDGGRADVDGDAVSLVEEARAGGDDALLVVDDGGELPAAGAELLLQGLQGLEVDGEPGQAPLVAERFLEPFEVAAGVVHVGLGDLDVVEAEHGIELDVADLGALADDLLVDLALGRDVDQRVGLEGGLAGEAAAGCQALALVEAGLGGGGRAEMAGGALQPVLGVAAFGHGHLAAAADGAAAADAVDVDAELAGGGEDGRAFGEAAALARGGEDEKWVGHASEPVQGVCEAFHRLAIDRPCRAERRPMAEPIIRRLQVSLAPCGAVAPAAQREQLRRLRTNSLHLLTTKLMKCLASFSEEFSEPRWWMRHPDRRLLVAEGFRGTVEPLRPNPAANQGIDDVLIPFELAGACGRVDRELDAGEHGLQVIQDM